jgi:hypothetical protein
MTTPKSQSIALTWAPVGKRKGERPNETWRRTTEREIFDPIGEKQNKQLGIGQSGEICASPYAPQRVKRTSKKYVSHKVTCNTQ